MSWNLQIVFACPTTVDEAEFNAWYDAHLPEILSIPIRSGSATASSPVVVDEDAGVQYRYQRSTRSKGIHTRCWRRWSSGSSARDSYATQAPVDDGGPDLPAWWDEVRFASWNCIATGERVAPR